MFCLIENDIFVKVDWERDACQVKSVSISMSPSFGEEIIPLDRKGKALFNDVRDFLKGKKDNLPVDLLDLGILNPFSEKVLCELRNSVPKGKTVSYGELAKLAGHPGAARAVGTVLRNNPFPLFFPCHRVIRNNGEIGLFQGNREGAELKKYLLELERTGN